MSDINTIGYGAYFPIELVENSVGNKTWKLISSPKLIEHNLKTLLSTYIGKIMNNEEFGTRIYECIEEPNTQAQAFIIRRFIKEAIEKYEPRIQFTDSTISIVDSKLLITIKYVIKENQTENIINYEVD